MHEQDHHRDRDRETAHYVFFRSKSANRGYSSLISVADTNLPAFVRIENTSLLWGASKRFHFSSSSSSSSILLR